MAKRRLKKRQEIFLNFQRVIRTSESINKKNVWIMAKLF